MDQTEAQPEVSRRVDWDKIRPDFVAGLSHAEIVARHNVSLAALRKQIARKHWVQRKNEVKGKLSQVMSLDVIADAQAMVRRGQEMLAKMAGDADNSVAMLTDDYSQPVGYDELEKRERTAGMLVKRIRDTCGLDDLKPTGILVIGQLRQFDESNTLE